LPSQGTETEKKGRAGQGEEESWFNRRNQGRAEEGVAEEETTCTGGGPREGVAEEVAIRRAGDEGRWRRGASVASHVSRSCTASQINLGCLETYRVSGRLVITLLQGHIRVMSF